MTGSYALTGAYTTSSLTGGRVHPLVSLVYRVRTAAMALFAAIVASRFLEEPTPTILWVLLLVNGVLWPHVAYLLATRAKQQRAMEHRHLLLDAAAIGAWIGMLGASYWPSTSLVTAVFMGITGVGGLPLLWRATIAGLVGFGTHAAFAGFTFHPESSPLTMYICIVNVILFTMLFALFSFKQSRRLIAARKLSDDQGRAIADAMHALSAARDSAEEAQQRAQAANRAKSMFLANMSHELRTPLNAIIGYSELLQEDAADMSPEEISADLRKVTGAGKHLLSLINDVLDFSKIEAGRMDLVLEPVDVFALVREVEGTAATLVAQHDNKFEVNVSPGIGTITADPGKVRQVLLNLLSNAAKFTKNGTVSLSAALFDKDGEEWIALSVRDTGIGLTREQFGRLFQAFAQADATTQRDHGGTGLGLALCRRFCLMMGGDIHVQSKPGAGSEFSMQLPVRGPAVEASTAAASGDAVDDATPIDFHTSIYRVPVPESGT
ncbi:MAG TPA: ATP-binding protein [Gemmatimonas sp.]|nr:ATP-binding protein [Gemmatimonas sp.]